ncbi:hypothetical protein U9M48_015970 [Paspalum notatum var. saurae]|uniref:DUF1618 domain-containing protein n=1 Tax=Paspalum notatum var. saurae TaxID=547442 RepID=A0AAQ3T642_PASNO
MAALPSWIILHKFIGVSFSDHLQAEDFYLLPDAPPRLSHFKIPVGQQIPANPGVLSVDLAAGLFLLRTNGYAVLSTVSRTVTPVRPRRADDPAILGVICCNGGRSMVVGLEYKPSNPKAWLHYYFPGGATAAWTTKEVDNPLLPLGLTGNFICKDVIAHDGRLWWVSDSITAASSSGLLSCDPSADNPQLVFSAGSDLLKHCQHDPCDKISCVDRRRVQVAGGKLRWVQILCEHTDLPRGSAGEALAVTMLTLDHHTAQWRRSEDHHLMSFADVWNDDSYKRTTLPRKEPAPVLIHPDNPSIVYFALSGYLFGVDMITKKVVGDPHRHGMMLDSEDNSSSPLLPWVVPRELKSGLLKAVAPLV